ncbi:Kielin/chordin-like protein [Holothuria leucospilota]|uniref:Kielin/chordin-like protein n=1 Tax=Holothuria leucospilota TaxID=206669 RepID=A0A9Q1BT97_HOLLE|nr:Kielin/chordin-like protein [Holothuria leucospilota]
MHQTTFVSRMASSTVLDRSLRTSQHVSNVSVLVQLPSCVRRFNVIPYHVAILVRYTAVLPAQVVTMKEKLGFQEHILQILRTIVPTVNVINCDHTTCIMHVRNNQNGNVYCQRVPCQQLDCPHQTQLVNTCCPVCIDVDCDYFGTTYEHGSIFPHAEDPCQECTCDDGTVFCQRNSCPRPQCPYPIQGECCETCDGCLFTGVEYSSGEIFEDPTTPCQDCECQSGYVSCTERPCEEPPCGYPVKPSGECCASCEGCFFGGRSYRNGETFGNPDNVCQMCDCRYGNVTCEKARCPFAACEYPTNDECGCPICNGCSYRGVEYRDGMSFPDPQDSCRECSCSKGYITCTNVQCPPPRCFHPALLPGQCCETCDSCLYEGQTYQNGQEFPDSVDSCRVCTCADGNVNCGTKLCGRVSCLHPMMDECNCPVCDGCMYEDVMVMSGDIFPDPNDVCRDCICELGSARCYDRQCPPANCTSPTEVPGECCPVCLEAECLEEPDPCGDCVCDDGNWVCETRPCPDVSCPHAGQGMCCLECNGCTFGGKPWANGDSFQDPADGCGICTCTNGFVTCEDPVCEPVDCPNPTVPAGRCCPVCVGQCTVDGVKYNNNEEFTPRSDPCQRCNCRNGQVFCSAVECSRLCGHPRLERGQCCPVCDGCSFEDIDYDNGAQFNPPSNPCHSCTCFNGNVECEVIECPSLECPTPVEVPGQCCSVCQECTYFGSTYIDGSTWPARGEPCTECRCVGTRVRCQPLTCANADCTHPVPGACCPLCESCLFEESIYNNGQTFRPDNCRQCNCLNGNVICTSEECPVLTCQNTVRDPGQCCDRCQGCLYEGFEYGSGETWISPFNLCLTCQCQDGVTMCTEIRCLTPDFCTNPVNVPGQCCPICPGCTYNGVTYQNGQSFNPHDDPCESCLCERGSLTCVRQSCPVLNDCPVDAIQPPAVGECCGTCTRVQEQRVCDETSLGQTYKPYSEPCITCMCTNSSTWECMQDMCPMLMCPRSERFKQKDECCPKCQRCVDEDTGSSYFTGQTWRKGSDSCIICNCDYGAISCLVEKCAELECEEGLEPVKQDGLCCPQCANKQVPCYYQGVQHESGERWARDECTMCECVEGAVQCETSRCQALFCAADEVPTLNPGSCCPVCTPRPATCIAFGDPHYRTFDGKLIHFQGTCRYVMSMECTNQDFIVEVKNSNRNVGGGVSWTEEVTVIVDGTQVDLGQSGIVKVDREIIIPPFLKGSVVNIERRGDGYYVNTNVGLKVLWDGSSYVEISIPGTYARRTCGLCGNFNGYPQDDLRTRSDDIVNSVAMFGNSWKVPGLDSHDCDADDIDPCDSAGYYIRKLANIKCASIKSARFTRCHSVVSPEPYYAACVYDLCACSSSDTCLCDAVGAYAAECRQAGVFIDWRDASLCQIDCPTERGLLFDECGPACPRTCINKDIPLDLINEQCLRPCVPGCQCPADKVLHSGACIPAENCPVDFKVNATIVTVGRGHN